MKNVTVYTLSFLQDMEKKMVPEADLQKPLERSKCSTENSDAIFLSTFVSVPDVTFISRETYNFSEQEICSNVTSLSEDSVS